MVVHLLAALNRKNFVIAKPILRQRTSNYDNVTVAKAPILLNWCRVMEMATSLGVPRNDVEPFFRASVNGPHLINNIILKKRFAPEVAVRELIPTIIFFWRYPIFWWKVVPLYLLPAFLVRGVRHLYHWKRKLVGI